MKYKWKHLAIILKIIVKLIRKQWRHHNIVIYDYKLYMYIIVYFEIFHV